MTTTEITKFHSMEEIVECLAPLILKTSESSRVTQYDAPVYLQNLRDGLTMIAKIKAGCTALKSNAKKELEKVEAVTRLEKFPEFAVSRGITKATEKDKQAFLVLQQEYEDALDEFNKWEAICTYVDNIRSTVYTCIDDTKKDIYSRTHYNNAQVRG